MPVDDEGREIQAGRAARARRRDAAGRAVLSHTPLTLDWSAWHAERSFVIPALFAVLFAAAFCTSLGGKPVFGRALLED